MSSVNWTELYRGPRYDEFKRRSGLLGIFLRTENWLNPVLLFLVLMIMTHSLEQANWVDEMPSLTATGLFGFVCSWTLAKFPVRSLIVHTLGLVFGLSWILVLILKNMQLADPLLGAGVQTRWSELWLRLHDWSSALIEGGVSSDPMPFVMMLVFATWAVSYISTWSVVRWKNAWVALTPPGFVLLTNISYLPGQPSLQLGLFLTVAVLLVLQLHFTRALSHWRRTRTVWPDQLSLEVASSGMLVALILVVSAWLVPTANHWGPIAHRWERVIDPVSDRLDNLGRVFVGVSSKRDLPVHSFGEVLPLQGKVNLSSEPLMEVTATNQGNLRGAVYDRYIGTGWLISDITVQSVIGITVEAAEFGTQLSQSQTRRPIRLEVNVLGSAPNGRLLSFGDPITTDVSGSLLLGANAEDVVGIAPQDRLEEGDEYVVVGSISAATIDTILATEVEYPPAIRSRYTQLPDDLPEAIGELARSLSGGRHPLSIARTIEAYLRTSYAYSLNVPDAPPLRDEVDYFLFDSKAGNFNHHASAMTVLLRTLDIPARVAVGFVLEPKNFDEATKAYRLSERDAWAWTEVYFPSLGWVEFNPTSGRDLVTRLSGDAAPQWLPSDSDNSVSPFDAEAELLELEALLEDQLGEAGTFRGGIEATSSGVGEVIVRFLTILMFAAVALVSIIISLRFAWEYPVRKLTLAHRQWAKLQRLASWGGIESRPSNTPLEEAHIISDVVGASEDFEILAKNYNVACYGNKTLEVNEVEAVTDSYRVARNQLWRNTFNKFLLPRRFHRSKASPVRSSFRVPGNSI